jgi:putative flippase GtrA
MDRSPNLTSFIIAGFAAVAANVLALCLLTSTGVNPLYAQLLSLTLAMVVSWLINRTWTYGEPGAPTMAEFGQYAAGGLTTAGVNFTIFALVLIRWPSVPPIEALAVGILAGLMVSFAGYARFVFRQDP